MKSNFKPIGTALYHFSDLIEEVTEYNADLQYGLSDIVGVTIDKGLISTVANLSQTALDKFYIVKPETFVYNPRTHGVKLGMGFNQTSKTFITSWNNVAFRVKESALRVVNPLYLWLYFNRAEWDRETNYRAWGSSTIVFAWNTFLSMLVRLPPKSYQDKLCKQYSIISNRIALKQRINDNLRNIATSAFDNLVRNIKIYSGSITETELGTIPSVWKIMPLKDVISLIIDHRGITPLKLGGEWSDDGIIALSAKSVKNHRLINLNIANRVDEALFEKWMPEKLQPHDILMTSEAPLGEFYYIASFCRYCLSQRLFAIRSNPDIIEPTVLYFQMSDVIGKHQIDVRKTGTTVTGIRQSELLKMPIVVPEKTVQSQFAALCNPIMLQIEKNEEECRKLSDIQTIILSKLSSR